MILFNPKSGKDFDVQFRQTSGNEAAVCPLCASDRKKKNLKPLSWDHAKGCGMCHHCNESFVLKRDRPEKTYLRPIFNNQTQLSDITVQYFQGRGISQKVLREAKITEGPEWMPQTASQINTVQFNYFREGELINTKFRGKNKAFKMVKDAELIFYNLDSIKASDTCIITEGEIDCLSWIEAGINSVVSVPNGASKGSQKMDYLDNCIEYFDGKTKIYLSTDNDEPGRALRDELARRLGVERCWKIDFGSLKDANEYLVYYGPERLLNLIETATEFPMDGVYTVMDNVEDIREIYLHGLPQGAKTGDPQVDSHIGFMPGELTVVTGIPGHGKSIYLDQLALGLVINSDWKFGICSPESHPMAFYFTRLIKRLTGKKFSRNNISQSELDQTLKWLESKFFMVMPPTGYKLDEILSRARSLVSRKGINALILDPWNRIESEMPSGMNEGKYIATCLIKIIEFAQRSGVHVFLVAHPTKMQKEKDGINFMVPNLYSISGSAHFFNMTHNGMTVFRNYTSEKTEVHIQKVKWEHLGRVGLLEYTYNPDNARFDSVLRADYSNWMDTKVFPSKTQSSMDDVLYQVDSLHPDNEPPF